MKKNKEEKKFHMLHVRLEESEYEKFKTEAEKEERSVNSMSRILLIEGLNNRKKTKIK